MSTAPTTELGSATGATNLVTTGGGLASWSALAGGDSLEHVPALTWPSSVITYKRMLNDAQVQGLYLGLTLPIRSYDFRIDPNGARPEIVAKLQEDLALDLVDAEPSPRRRGQRRFSFHKHIEDALRAVVYGHYFFEQVGEIQEDLKWHLRKLAPRPPYTISEIAAEKDGGLKHIRQQTGPNDPPIPVDRLVAYVWDREGANWMGRSMFRSSYPAWLLKDRVLRVGAINIERAGGVPYVEAPPGADADSIAALDRLAQNFKVGESSGGAIPHGAQLKLAQAAGGDAAVAYIKLMNEEMSRSFLLMILQLGQTVSGSRALGGEFNDLAALAQSTICEWMLDTFNLHVIEDWVEWNYGPTEEFAPLVVYEAGATDPMAGFDQQVQDGNLSVQPGGQTDQQLNASRRRVAMTRGARQARRSARAAGTTSPVSLPSRPLRRQPYPQEITAAVDFDQMDKQWTTKRESLVTAYEKLQATQIEELGAAIVSAKGDLAAVSEISATPTGDSLIAERLQEMARTGVSQIRDEADRQGAKVASPVLQDVDDLLASRASAVSQLLARSISNAGATRAMRLTGGSMSPEAVAKDVVSYLSGLSGTYLQDQLGGALTAGQNAGRKAALREEPPAHLYASELLDQNTCENCTAVDGTEYDNVGDAELDYPTGGYGDCLGQERCRGTLIGVYGEE